MRQPNDNRKKGIPKEQFVKFLDYHIRYNTTNKTIAFQSIICAVRSRMVNGSNLCYRSPAIPARTQAAKCVNMHTNHKSHGLLIKLSLFLFLDITTILFII